LEGAGIGEPQVLHLAHQQAVAFAVAVPGALLQHCHRVVAQWTIDASLTVLVVTVSSSARAVRLLDHPVRVYLRVEQEVPRGDGFGRYMVARSIPNVRATSATASPAIATHLGTLTRFPFQAGWGHEIATLHHGKYI
jgi:hypothetical protein